MLGKTDTFRGENYQRVGAHDAGGYGNGTTDFTDDTDLILVKKACGGEWSGGVGDLFSPGWFDGVERGDFCDHQRGR
jgi:hypothetical protein